MILSLALSLLNKCYHVVYVLYRLTNKRQGMINLHSKQLVLVNSAKYLGVTIDSKLLFNQHVDNICKKANSVLGFLRRNFNNSPHKVKADLYLIYIKPILEYAVPVWAPHTRCLINKLESIQRRAAHFVMSDYYLTSSVSAMLHRLERNTIESQVKVLSLVLFYKIIHGQVDLITSKLTLDLPEVMI